MLRPIASSLAYVVKKKKSFTLRNSKAGFSSFLQLIKTATKKLKAKLQAPTNPKKKTHPALITKGKLPDLNMQGK